jgi:hypothetical protein
MTNARVPGIVRDIPRVCHVLRRSRAVGGGIGVARGTVAAGLALGYDLGGTSGGVAAPWMRAD